MSLKIITTVALSITTVNSGGSNKRVLKKTKRLEQCLIIQQSPSPSKNRCPIKARSGLNEFRFLWSYKNFSLTALSASKTRVSF